MHYNIVAWCDVLCLYFVLSVLKRVYFILYLVAYFSTITRKRSKRYNELA